MSITKKVWIIVSKDRKVIAKGAPMHRYLISIDNEEDTKRVLTYGSKQKAEIAFSNYSFNQLSLKGKHYGPSDLEAVEATFSIDF